MSTCQYKDGFENDILTTSQGKGKCLYTAQGDFLCKATPMTDMAYGRSIMEGFAEAGTTMTNTQMQKYAAMLKDGCYSSTKNTSGGYDFAAGPKCDQMIANIAVDKCSKGAACSIDKSRAKGAMKACPDTIMQGVNKSKEAIKPNIPALTPDMLAFDARGRVTGVTNGPEFAAKLNTIFQC
jgi:hypothetical protein